MSSVFCFVARVEKISENFVKAKQKKKKVTDYVIPGTCFQENIRSFRRFGKHLTRDWNSGPLLRFKYIAQYNTIHPVDVLLRGITPSVKSAAYAAAGESDRSEVRFGSVSVWYPGDKNPSRLTEKTPGRRPGKENCKIAANISSSSSNSNNNGGLTAAATAPGPHNPRSPPTPHHIHHRSGWPGTNAYVTLWWRRDIRMSHNSP